MKNYSRNFKKGNIAIEAITLLLIMVVFAIAGLFAYSTFDSVNDDIQASTDLSNTSKETTQNLYNIFPSWIDNAFLLIFVLFVLFIVISVFFIDTHPIFFGITVILLIGVLVATIFIGNVYYDIASDSSLSAYANDLPYTYWVLNHIVELMLGIVFITSIALFAKLRG